MSNFRDKYHLTDLLSQHPEISDGEDMNSLVRSLMLQPTEGDGFRVHRKEEGTTVYFSSDAYDLSEDDVMLLSLVDEEYPEGVPVVALRYNSLNRGERSWARTQHHGEDSLVTIYYIQTLRDPNGRNTFPLKVYQHLQETIGERPHEFLFAQFIGRLAPGLDRYPDIGVFYVPYAESAGSFKAIRDRFLEKRHYGLSPSKARVRDILGAENAWLEARR